MPTVAGRRTPPVSRRGRGRVPLQELIVASSRSCPEQPLGTAHRESTAHGERSLLTGLGLAAGLVPWGCARHQRPEPGQAPQRDPSPAVRPTSDRVREAIFDIIARSGRGRPRCRRPLLRERGPGHRSDLARCAFGDLRRPRPERALCGAYQFGSGGPGRRNRDAQARRAAEWLEGASHFDLALCDPPYAFDAWDELLGHLDARWPCSNRGAPSRCAAPGGHESAATAVPS